MAAKQRQSGGPAVNPDPSGGTGDCWRELIGYCGTAHPLRERMIARRQLGIERYGQPLRYGDGRDARLDYEEELLDAAVYAWRLGYLADAMALLAMVPR